MTRWNFVWTAGLLVVIGGTIGAQERTAPTARELFYGEPSSKKPAPTPPKSAPKPKENPPRPVVVSPPPKPPRTTPAPVNASYTPLGLRYSIVKRTAGGPFSETDVDATFRSGDGIRVILESNDDAYLYIVNKGSSGTWSLLFPSPDINNGHNRVQARQTVEIPPVGQFTFADEPGEERVFIVLSRPPEADLEQLISSLARAERPKDVAQQAISDELVGRLRSSVIARDLIFEKDPLDTSGRKEKAAYVVNVNGSGASRVVADFSLQHK